jgi:hypothetical protein
MSDDKNPKDSAKGDGTGSESGKTGEGTPSIPFGELIGHIDSRIETLLEKRRTPDADKKTGSTGAGTENPESIRDQLRAELAKLQGEEAAKQKDAERDVTLQELKDQVAQLAEAKPQENVSKLTQIMWGKRK